LAERFRRYLSESPMAYLAHWRLQLGAQLLKSTSRSVADIAAEVGYESEPSFNRAFKRQFGHPPARFRSQLRASRRTSATPPASKSRLAVTSR
jgi:transcriptional regulator GlxA family with amidase domain